MLLELRLKDWVLVEEARLELGPGLSVVTGETGAGKSLLVGALQALLGDRVRSDVVRTGAEQAEVEGVFDVSEEPTAGERLAEAGLPADADLLIRRVVEAGGRSRAYLNGRLAVGAVLREVTAGLVDLTSQHEHHRLVDPAGHLEILDLFAGLGGERVAMGAAHGALRRAADDLAALDRSVEERAASEELLRFQLGEIDAASPKPGETAELVALRERLRHAGRLEEACALGEEVLYARDGSASSEIARSETALGGVAHLDERIADAVRRLAAARAEVEDVAADLGRFARSIEMDPERLAAVEERLAVLHRLERKHGGDLERVLAARDRLAAELEAMSSRGERLEDLRGALERARERAAEIARDLGRRRREAAVTLGARISTELRELAMGDARIEVEVTRVGAEDAGEALRTIDGARLGPTGIDRAEILLAANPGEPVRALRRIASGGELSRAMLAIETVLSGVGRSGTFVFDEVDAGIGGATAEVVGRKLLDIARHHQVLCVTHLPQVASLAQTHFVVEKRRAGSRTVSHVRRLGARERGDEIARMLGGLKVTRKTRAAAEEMIRLAKRASPS